MKKTNGVNISEACEVSESSEEDEIMETNNGNGVSFGSFIKEMKNIIFVKGSIEYKFKMVIKIILMKIIDLFISKKAESYCIKNEFA